MKNVHENGQKLSITVGICTKTVSKNRSHTNKRHKDDDDKDEMMMGELMVKQTHRKQLGLP